MTKERVDVLAYKQGLFETREQAKRGVMAGLVVAIANGQRFDKPGEKIDESMELKLKGEKLKYVSRGGLKLEKALQVFDISVEEQVTLDIGASTGGFTDVMLQNGAQQVYAVDLRRYLVLPPLMSVLSRFVSFYQLCIRFWLKMEKLWHSLSRSLRPVESKLARMEL